LLFFFLFLVEMKEDSLGSYPLLDFKGKPNAVDELVCFQEAQILPLFLVVPKRVEMVTSTLAPGVSHASPAGDLSQQTRTYSLITRAVFERLKTQELIDHLIAEGVELDDKEKGIFREQKITGEALIDSSKEDLVSVGIPLGVAKMILRRLPKE